MDDRRMAVGENPQPAGRIDLRSIRRRPGPAAS
jgi:hypothetical protein